MLEEKRYLEYENNDLKRELEDWKRKGQTQLNVAQLNGGSKEKEDTWQREVYHLFQHPFEIPS